MKIKKHNNLNHGNVVVIAIIIAGLLVAGAVFLNKNNNNAGGGNVAQEVGSHPSGDFRLPNESDHIRGNVDAKVAIVEFSDFECPFCSRLHPTLTKVVKENPDVKWIYRHFPLSSHSRAFEAAVASECIAKLGGNDAFWNFADTAFANQRHIGDSLYEEVASASNIDIETFRGCLEDKNIANEVSTDLSEVIASGGRGTPFAIVITASGKLFPFSGALPYEQIKSLVDQALVN